MHLYRGAGRSPMPARYAEKADQVRTSPHRLPGVGLKVG